MIFVADVDKESIFAFTDGVIASSAQNGLITNNASNASDLFIGNTSALNRPFNGSLNDIRIYNRVLTPAEIQVLYNEGN